MGMGKNMSGNAATYFVDRHNKEAYAKKAAFIEFDGKQRVLSYRKLALESSKLADLYKRHNIARNDRVALLLLDQIEFPVVFWGSLKAGVVPVALNTLLATDVYATILQDCQAKALFVSDALLPVVEPLLQNHATIKSVFVTGEGSSWLSFDDEIKTCESLKPVSAAATDIAFWLYSSGSTGRPKGVRHAHGGMQYTSDTYGQQVMGVNHDDVVYSAAKFFFAYGLGNAMTFPMAVAATTVLLSGRPTPDGVLDILNKQSPTIFCGVPTLYAATIAHLESGAASCQAPLRRCISAGEALPASVGHKWKEITGCDILDGVGSTEMLHIFLSNRADDVEYGTSGIAVPGYELRLVNTQGDEVGVDEVGELLVKGISSAVDYWNQPEKSAATFENGWTRTGDKYERNAGGRLVYCGRTDDMFKVSGIWVSPFEVEQAIMSHPDVLEAAVVAARDEQGLEKPKAFVVLKNQQENTEFVNVLKDLVKERIGKWKYPRWVEIVSDLPKTATGKIQRFKLRDQ